MGTRLSNSLRTGGRRRLTLGGGLVLVCAAAAVALAGPPLGDDDGRARAGAPVSASDRSGGEIVLNDLRELPEGADDDAPAREGGGRVVDVLGPGDQPEQGLPPAPGGADKEGRLEPDDAPSPGAPTDEDIDRELAGLKKHAGRKAGLTPDGQAIAPFGAPRSVQRIIAAGNIISRTPYKWGGGHGRWLDDGYDCSGSVSFALAAAALLDGPLVSGQLADWGASGRGRWVTIYANDGHVWMTVAGMRFDTSGRSSRNGGSRWQPEMRSPAGYEVRHPPGL